MILWKISLREIRSHRGRAFLTAASIVIGVAAVVAVNLAAVAVRISFGTMQATIAGDADLQVDAAGDILFEETLASDIAQVPGVKDAVPVFARPTVMYYGEGVQANVILMGVDPEREDLLRDYVLEDGELLSTGDEVLMDSVFAAGAQLKTGDDVRLLTSRGPRPFTIAGLLRPKTGAAVGRGGALFMPLATAQRRLGRRESINQVQIILVEDADPATVQAAVENILPEGLSVHPPLAQSQMGEETMRSLQTALRLATWFAALAAVFIVANAFFMNVSQRHRQLAVMRAIGATRGQVRLLILREAAALAVLGIVAGLVLGWGGAVLLSDAMEQLSRTQLPRPELTPQIIAWAVAFGLGMSVLGALFPARTAARVEPIEGMHEVTKADTEGFPRWLLAFGAIGFVVSGVLLALNRLTTLLPDYDYVLGAIVLLVFGVMLLPLALRNLASLAAIPAGLLGRAEARLARQQLLRRQIRTVLTIGVLFVASSTGLGLASNVIDAIEDVQTWYRRVMAGDFFLRTMMFDLANWDSPPMPEGVEEQVRAIPHVRYVYGARFMQGEAAGESVMMAARDFPSAETISAVVSGLTAEELRQKFLEGYVTIGTVLAQRTGLRAGDEIEIETSQGPVKKEIAAIINDYMGGGLVVHMGRQEAEKLLGVQGVDAFVIRAEPGRKDEVEAALERIARDNGVLLQSYTELTQEIDGMMAGVIGGLWIVMILGLVVAALGVTNTLSMNVLEQTRELAMLRVIAMTRSQTRRTIMAQAAMIGVIGLLPGVILGLGLSWLINQSMLGTVGRQVAYGFHPGLAVGGFLAAMALVILAAWIPAQRAANLEPIQALRYE